VLFRSQLAIIAKISINKSSTKEIPLMVGEVYFNDYKDFGKARVQFENAIATDAEHKGDAHLYLGKSLLKLAYKPGKRDAEAQLLLKKASKQFQLSVENIATCTNPDEASWLMVQTGISIDTVQISKQKQYIETLINKYKNSRFQEEWYHTLAHDLAFSQQFEDESKTYYQSLIRKFNNSAKISSYIFEYAQLTKDGDIDKSIVLFKQIALEHSESPEAVKSLLEVATYFETRNLNQDAAKLYTLLSDQYYYTELADEADDKIGSLNLKAGLNTESIASLTKKVDHPFINDAVLSKEFLSSGFKNKLVFLGMAYRSKQDFVKIGRASCRERV